MIEALLRSTTAFTPQVAAVLRRAWGDAVRILGSRDRGPDARLGTANHRVAHVKNGETDEARSRSRRFRAASDRKRDAPKEPPAGDLPAPTPGRRPVPAGGAPGSAGEQALSEAETLALRASCGPVGVLGFPPPEVIHSLRRLGYVTIVLGGLQITPLGLERLLRERVRCCEIS